jgi:hypothetical protein
MDRSTGNVLAPRKARDVAGLWISCSKLSSQEIPKKNFAGQSICPKWDSHDEERTWRARPDKFKDFLYNTDVIMDRKYSPVGIATLK